MESFVVILLLVALLGAIFERYDISCFASSGIMFIFGLECFASGLMFSSQATVVFIAFALALFASGIYFARFD